MNSLSDKFLDLSCHPGSISDDEIEQQKEIFIEKCKDLKFRYFECVGCDENLRTFQEKYDNSKWVENALEACAAGLNGIIRLNG